MQETARTTTVTPLAMGSTPVTLRLWHSWTGRSQQALDTLARNFEQQNPGIRLSLQAQPITHLVRSYNEQVADGTAPQLLLVRSRYLGELAGRQHIWALDGVLSAADLAGFDPAVLTTGQVTGQQYGLPLNLDALVFWYDRRALTNLPTSLAQLPIRTPVATQAANPAAVPDPPAALAYHLALATTLPYFAALDGRLTTPEDPVAFATSSRSITLRWLNQLQALAAQPQVRASTDLSVVDRAFQTSQTLSGIDWTHRWAEYVAIWGADAVGVGPLPPLTADSPPPATVIMADVLCVNTVTTPEQREAAAALLRYLASADAQTLLAKQAGSLPASREAEVEPSLQPLQAATSRAVALPTTLDSRSWTVLDQMIQSVLSGNTGPEQALDAAANELRQTAR